MNRMMALALLCAGLTAPAWAQSTQPADETVLFVGVVAGSNVYVRSGPSASAYPCTKLSSPARVSVVEKIEGWYKILPPPGAFSVVSKDFLTPDADGQVGTINGDNVRVRPGGDLRDRDFTGLQGLLHRGAKVRILGQVGDFYKIDPPKGAYFYVSADYVRREGEGPLARMTRPFDANAVEMVVLPRPPVRGPTEGTTPPVNPAAAAEREAFTAAEKALQEEYAKPVDQQDLDALLARYQGISLSADSPLKPYVEYRVKFLESAIQMRKDRQAVRDLLNQAAARQKELDAERARIEMQAAASRPAAEFAAQGVLAPSEVFPGGARGPKRYIVRDAQSGKITAYIQSSTGAVDLERYVGKNVGVYGAKRFDSDVRVFLVEAEEVVVLPGQVEMERPAKPVVTFSPPPPPPAPPAPPAPPPPPDTTPPIQPRTAPSPRAEPASGPGPGPSASAPAPPHAEPAILPSPAPVADPAAQASAHTAEPAVLPKPSAPSPAGPPLPAASHEEPAVLPMPAPAPSPAPAAPSHQPAPAPAVEPIAPSAMTPPTPPAATAEPSPPAPAAPPAGLTPPTPTSGPVSPSELMKLLPETGLPVAPASQTTTKPLNEEEYR